MASAVVYRNDKTLRMMTFGPDERPRSLQIYGSDPDMLGRAVHLVCDEGRVDHVDLNFGCPAAKVTRRGGGAAVPAKPRLLRAVVRRGGGAPPSPYGVPVTAKFRMGLWDDLRTDIDTGLICADEGVTWIALHARTVEQHYAGEARWEAIGRAQAGGRLASRCSATATSGRPPTRSTMMRATGCDGVVVGRGCLGRPWLFGDLVDRPQRRRGAGAAPARRRDRRCAPSRPPAGRSLSMATVASRWRCATSASTPPGTCRATRSAPRCGCACRRSPR